MLRIIPPALLLAITLPSATVLAESSQAQAQGFVEDSTWMLLNRSVYDNRDYRHGARSNGARNAVKPFAERNGYAEEWAYGLMGTFTSGFSQGTVGVGVDAHLYHGLKLDSGGGRGGKARLLGAGNDHQVKDDITRGGAALKLRVASTTLTYGEQRVKTPIFSSSDSRLLPETATGFLLRSQEMAALALLAGHFTESTDRNASSHDQGFVVNYSNGRQGDHLDFLGLLYSGSNGLTASAYSSRYEDSWRQYYLGGSYRHPLDVARSITVDLNVYRTTDTGDALSGRIDNTSWSLLTSYQQGAQSLSLGYQEVSGDTPFDYVTRGAIWLGNAAQLSDFNAPNERSWQVRYGLDMATLGWPGLSLSASYIRGTGIDGSRVDPDGGYAYLGYGRGGKHWERDIEGRYQVQNGMVEGLIMSLRVNAHRGNAAQAELDTDQVRLALEYPLNGTF